MNKFALVLAILAGVFLAAGCSLPTEPTDVATGTNVNVQTGDGSTVDGDIDIDVSGECSAESRVLVRRLIVTAD